MFSAFNILLYAQNHILKLASSPDEEGLIKGDEQREDLYSLYEFALKLEPKPERPEPTLAQLQMVNRARSFVTMKMKKRANLRESKSASKNILKLKKLLGSQIQQKMKEFDDDDNEAEIDE